MVLDDGHEIMAEFGNIRQDAFKVVNDQTNMQGFAKNCDEMDEQKGVLDNGHEITSCELAKIKQAVFHEVNI